MSEPEIMLEDLAIKIYVVSIAGQEYHFSSIEEPTKSKLETYFGVTLNNDEFSIEEFFPIDLDSAIQETKTNG